MRFILFAWRSWPVMRSSLSGWALVALAVTLLLLPLQWVIGAIFAAAFHEACHAAAVRLCGGRITSIQIGSTGMTMAVLGLNAGQELLCALAGPVGSSLLLFVASWFPRLAICAGLQGLYNLLPIYPLDGGRAVRCAAYLLLPRRVGETVCRWVERGCLVGILLLGVYGSFHLHLGMLPLFGAFWMILHAIRGKIPCKPWGNSVQ